MNYSIKSLHNKIDFLWRVKILDGYYIFRNPSPSKIQWPKLNPHAQSTPPHTPHTNPPSDSFFLPCFFSPSITNLSTHTHFSLSISFCHRHPHFSLSHTHYIQFPHSLYFAVFHEFFEIEKFLKNLAKIVTSPERL